MISIAFKPIVSRFIQNILVQPVCITLLLSISCSSWAQGQVDLLTTNPMLVYKISHQTLAEKDNLKIEVYNDGFAILHYPAYMKNSGDYSVQLSQADIQRLIYALDTPEIKSFDSKAIGLQKKSHDQTNRVISYVSDTSDSSFEVRRSNAFGKNKIKQKINCPHLQYDAKQHPNIRAIKQLAEVELLLVNLINQSDVQELADD